MTLLVEQAAFMMSVQDLGRGGYQRFGLPEAGPMDWWAHRAANRLVGNAPEAACVEVGFSSAAFRVEHAALLAICGAGYRVWVGQRSLPLWMAFWVSPGEQIILEKEEGGNWVYLAAAGGLETPLWMGSRSAYPRAGLGRLLKSGDRLPAAPADSANWERAGSFLPQAYRPQYHPNPTLRAVSGPHQDRFEPESAAQFWEMPFVLSSRSDRMGYRFNGTKLTHRAGADLVSQGMALGEVQVPGDGQPIVMMPDHPTTGGYTCIATVIRCDLPLLAQAAPGSSEVRFQPVEVETAQDLLRQTHVEIETGIQPEEDLWLYL